MLINRFLSLRTIQFSCLLFSDSLVFFPATSRTTENIPEYEGVHLAYLRLDAPK